MTASTITVYPGLNSAGASLTVYAEDLATLIPASGAVVPYTAYYTSLLANGRLMTSDPLSGSGDAITVQPVTRVAGALAGNATPQMYGGVADGTTDCTDAIQAALDSGASELTLSPGIYRTTRQLFVSDNMAISCSRSGCAEIVCDGTDWDPALPEYAIVINSAISSPYNDPAARQQVKRPTLKNITVRSPAGGGIFAGSSINPHFLIESVLAEECLTYGFFFGEATYFVTMFKSSANYCEAGGVKVLAYCDLFTLDTCSFGANSGYDVDIGTTNFRIEQCDFELHTGVSSGVSGEVAANLCLRTSDVQSGYAIVANNRFGPEQMGAGINPYDIHITNNGTTEQVLRGIRFYGNRHFSPAGAIRKTAPMLLDSGVGSMDIIASTHNGLGVSDPGVVGYSSSYLVETTDASNVLASTTYVGNFIDELELAKPSIAAVFQSRGNTERNWQRVVAGLALSAYDFVFAGANDTGIGRNGTPRVFTMNNASYSEWFANDIVGMALTAAAQDSITQIVKDGTIIVSTLNAAALTIGDPVYMGAAGNLSLTPHASVVKIVGRLLSQTTNAMVQLDFSEPARWVAMPTKGGFKIGDEAPKATLVVAGAAASQYVIRGWLRLTNAVLDPANGNITNNVLNTDWVEMRTLTGT